jgi:predicted Zn-dependent peptidase
MFFAVTGLMKGCYRTETSMTSIHESVLPNGLRVVLQPDAAIPQVGIAIYYDVGSRNETPGTTGFAHLFEHMMFQGSAHVDKGEHFRLVHAWGGSLNGTTSQDRTNYYLSLPSHQLRLGLWLEADRMRSLAVTEENFENQRETVMEERRQRVDNSPYGAAFVRLGELSYENFAYSHPVIGSWEDLENAKLEQVQDFHGLWYRPDNAVLAISGDFELEYALDVIHDFFGDIQAGGNRPNPNLDEPVREQSTRERVTDGLAHLPAVFINHQAPPYGDPDFYVYEVIETLLLRGPSSRLYRRMVIEEGSAIQVSGGYEAHRGPSLFGVFAVLPRDGDMGAFTESYLEELQRLVTEPVSEDDIQKVCNQLHSARIFGQESVVNRAMSLGRSVLYHNDAHWEERYIERLLRVQPEDIQRVAARDFRTDRCTVLEVVPE